MDTPTTARSRQCSFTRTCRSKFLRIFLPPSIGLYCCALVPMTCQAQNFTSVPVGVPYDSQRVFLQNNRITELRVGSFGFGTQVLWLFSNNITWIEAGSFSELRDLEELDLGDNSHLRRLEGGAFRGLEKLQSLHMHRCKLTALPHDLFHKLYSLQFLYLQENQLHFLQDDLFSDLINLSQLFLHGNRIRTLSENVFRGLVNLDRLLLHDNRVRQVNRRAFRDLGRLTMLFLFNNSLAELPGQALRDTQGIEFLRLNGNPWSCGCEALPLWEWFRGARVSSSELLCSSPSPRRGMDLRFLREMDFALCPLPDPGTLAGSTTRTFSTKTRWWFSKHKPQSQTKAVFEKSSETIKAFPFPQGKNNPPIRYVKVERQKDTDREYGERYVKVERLKVRERDELKSYQRKKLEDREGGREEKKAQEERTESEGGRVVEILNNKENGREGARTGQAI
uniref:Reticulon 4 receptor-like 2 a n=1 Tax=Hucho hucho TaxID=62062 RepID=A0A4W5KLU5_9TELE